MKAEVEQVKVREKYEPTMIFCKESRRKIPKDSKFVKNVVQLSSLGIIGHESREPMLERIGQGYSLRSKRMVLASPR
jgi:hypothetical protein